MRKELAFELALAQQPDARPHQLMRLANEIVAANDPCALKPFLEVDIVFAEYADYLRATCGRREIDLIYVSDTLQRCWLLLHSHVGVEGATLGEFDRSTVASLHESLVRLGLTHLLENGLNERAREMLRNICIESEQNNEHKQAA